MARINVDDTLSDVPAEPGKRVREVVESVAASLPPNRIVTGVILDGKPIARAAALQALDNAVASFEQVDIRTSDREIWRANGIDMALSCIERVQRSLILTAEWFHDPDASRAHRMLAQCMEGLERFTETLIITRAALRLDFDAVAVDGIPLSRVHAQLEGILKNILECQEQGDNEGIAERIEFALLPNLSLWGEALRNLRRSQTSNA